MHSTGVGFSIFEGVEVDTPTCYFNHLEMIALILYVRPEDLAITSCNAPYPHLVGNENVN